jgi:flavodoxin
MRILCAYYSWKGHTETVAKRLSEVLHAEPTRILAAVTESSGMFGKAMRALFVLRAPIMGGITDLSLYDMLVLASPVWAQKVPPYVNEYISRLTNCEGKPCYVLVEMGGSGAERAVSHLKGRLEKKGLKFMGSAFTIEKDVDSGMFNDPVEKFAGSILAGKPGP